MLTIGIQNSMVVSGIVINDVRSVAADNMINATEDIPVGIAGTAGAAGAMTVAAGHGYTTGTEVVCVSWLDAGAVKYRYGCTITVSPETVITCAGGTGDTLPTSGAVVICKKTEINLAFLGTDLKALSIGADIALVATVEDAGGVELAVSTSAKGAYSWDSGNGAPNPVTGDSIILANVYNRGITAGTVGIIAAYDN